MITNGHEASAFRPPHCVGNASVGHVFAWRQTVVQSRRLNYFLNMMCVLEYLTGLT